MRWRDIAARSDGTGWAGLHFEVDTPERPRLRVEAAPLRIRVTLDDAPVLWAAVHPFYQGVWWARGDAPTSAIAPLRVDIARAIDHAPGSVEWYRAWARECARRLAESSTGPLHRGTWRLEPASWSPREDAADVATHALGGSPPSGTAPRHGLESWMLSGSGAVLALRDADATDSGRIKALRKQARAGELAPILLWWVSALDMACIIDGHDRLQASLLEGCSPRALLLSHGFDETHASNEEERAKAIEIASKLGASAGVLRRATIDCINQGLLAAFVPHTWWHPHTRAWPMTGGRAQWDREVRAHVRAEDWPDWLGS